MQKSQLLYLLLPGMDGTGQLFAALQNELGRAATQAIRYPPDELLGYDELEQQVRSQFPTESCILVAESFSGPVAIRIAANPPSNLIGIVLVTTFVRSPIFFPARLIHPILPILFRLPLPKMILWRLTGESPPGILTTETRLAIQTVDPEVMAHRAAAILSVDVSDALVKIKLPILYLEASHDRVVSSSSGKLIRSLRPDIEFRKLDGPHLLLQTLPVAAADILCEFGAGCARFRGN